MATIVQFSVTYDVVTYGSAMRGEFEESGFSVEPTIGTLRDVIEGARNRGISDIEDHGYIVRVMHWTDTNHRTGEETTKTTHITTTPKLAGRIVKLLTDKRR